MNTPELRLILQSCFSSAQLRSLLQDNPPDTNVYDAAVDAILNETGEGNELIQLLDQESAPQRKKIQGLKVPELRNGMTFEFLEPGRMLGLVLWSLLRDNRLSAHDLAAQLARKHIPSPAAWGPAEGEGGEGEAGGSGRMADESEEDLEGGLGGFSLEEMEQLTAAYAADPAGADFGKETVPGEAGSLAGSWGEEETRLEENTGRTEAREDPSITARNKMERAHGGKILKSRQAARTGADPARTVPLGGIEISLVSLTRACEKIYEEPIELVTDENLIHQDKLVVVGKQCGIRILAGPRTAPLLETPQPDTGEPVTIDPESLKSALSRIYNDPVELIPDAALLAQGTIAFAGKSTGLFILRNPRVRISLSALESSTGQAPVMFQPGYGALDAMRKQLAALEMKIADLEKKISAPAMDKQSPGVLDLEEEVTGERVPFEEPIDDHFTIDDECLGMEEAADSSTLEESLSAGTLESWEKVLLDSDQAFEEQVIEERIEEVIHEAPPAPIQPPVSEPSKAEAQPIPGIKAESKPVPGSQPQIKPVADVKAETKPASQPQATPLAEMKMEIQREPEKLRPADPILSTLSPAVPEEEDDLGLDLESLGDLSDIDLASLGLEEDETRDAAAGLAASKEDDQLTDEEISLEDLNLDDLDLESLGIGPTPAPAGTAPAGGEVKQEEEDLDFDLLKELGLTDIEDVKPVKIFRGEQVLLLGGEEKNAEDYQRIVKELGGLCAWYPRLADVPEGEIAHRVEQADVMVTFSSEAITDPGILQAMQYAKANYIPLFQHHSASPVSVQKYLMKLKEEGKIGV